MPGAGSGIGRARTGQQRPGRNNEQGKRAHDSGEWVTERACVYARAVARVYVVFVCVCARTLILV